MNKKILLLWALSASLVLVGCGQQPQPKPEPQPETPAVSSGENMPSEQPMNSPDMPNPETNWEDMMTPPVESGSEAATGASEVSTWTSSTTSDSETTSGTSSSTSSSDMEPSTEWMWE